jgi:hypothetical protein
MHYSKIALFLVLLLLLPSSIPVQPAGELKVIAHPDGKLYVGDQVSFEVLASAATSDKTGSIQVSFDGQEIGSAGFAPYGIGERNQAILWWVWDTFNLNPGNYTLTFTRLPENTTWNESFLLNPENHVPYPEPEAHWVSIVTACCTLYYITGTAAERDIATLSQEADEQSAAVSVQMGARIRERINIIFMNRVVGHGGFTWSGMYVTYLDDNYIGNDMAILFHHEFVHYYDNAMGGGYLPTILQEGLAVYLTGGHFKSESLGPRTAAALDLGWYIPLTTLADGFYNLQHDIGYLEAGSLVQYLVETYGWDAFNEFYKTNPAPNNQTDSSVMDIALQDHFGISFAGLETAFLSSLRTQSVPEEVRTDLQLTVTFFDTVRRYQETFDPSAYFLTAWLPDNVVMRQRGIVADFLRHPERWENRLIEPLLIRSQKELFSRNYKSSQSTLRWINVVLNLIAPKN